MSGRTTPRRPAELRPGVPRAKTAVPGVPAGHVPRPRVMAALDAAAAGQVTVVCAPAGYGKTLALAEWAARRPGGTAWVSLDVDDNDDRRFWSALLTALGSLRGVPRNSPLRRRAVPGRPSRDPTFLAAVVNALDVVPGPVRIVLDDVHELSGADPLYGLGTLVRDRPPGLQVVLSGRAEPPLGLSRLRLAGEVCEIRAGTLRFSASEAGALLAASEVPPRPDQVQAIVDQTEGWAAGLRLAARSLRDVADPDRFLTDLVGNGHAVSDYLVGEVLQRVPADVLDVLRAGSVCEQVSAPLAVALSGRPDAGEVLDALEHDTALVVSSGSGRTWYRLHPLLRAHLLADLRRRRPDLVTRSHAVAAGWFEAQREPAQALAHARRAAAPGHVAALLRRNGAALLAGGAHGLIREALDFLGDPYVADDAWLALVAAVVDLETGAVAAADRHRAWADRAWPAEPAEDLTAFRALVRARRIGLVGNPRAMVQATERLGSAAEEHLGLAVMGELDRALALLAADRPDEARGVAGPAVERAQRQGQDYLAARGLSVLATVAGAQGDYRCMVDLAERADATRPGPEWRGSAGAARTSVLRAYGALLRAQPSAGLELLGDALTFAARAQPEMAAEAAGLLLAVRGAACADLHPGPAALEDLRHARATVGSTTAPGVTGLVALLEHRAALQLGRHELARTVVEWAGTVLGESGDVALMRAERLSALGRHRAAADALGSLRDGSARALVPWAVLAGWVLDCRLAVLAGRRTYGRAALDRALELTDAMGALRPLALGPPEVVELLTHHLGTFGALEMTARQVLRARHGLVGGGRPVALTERERAVLGLLPSQRSFDEIAVDLTVAHSTVKTHVRAIYSKLGVTSRREAVDRARTNGLLLLTD
jgi:LuxR family transcriptional regulator, maltose regulon positive regulatory protein